MRPLALVGNLSRDRVDGGPPRIGGAPFYGAAALRLLGRRGHVVAKCAGDDKRRYSRALARVGVPVTFAPAAATTAFSFSYRGDARTMHVDDVGPVWKAADVADIHAATWVHVAPLLRGDFDADALAAIARGRRVLYDAHGLVRRRAAGPLELDRDFDPALLEHVAVLKLGEEEARVLEPVTELGVDEVVVTLGSRGAIVYAQGQETHVPAHPIAAVDPTGAGDAFGTAYAVSRAEGFRPVSAARRATAVVAAFLAADR